MNDKITKPVIKQGWARVLFFLLAIFIATIVFQFLGLIVLFIAGVEIDLKNMQRFITNPENFNIVLLFKFFDVCAAFLAVLLFVKSINRQPLKSLGFIIERKGKDMLFGFVVGLLLISLGFTGLYFTNNLEVSGVSLDIKSTLISLLFFTLVAFHEEVIFRGYVLGNLMDSMNKYVALLISSILFMLIHGMNPNISLLAAINLMLAGVVLGISYIHTRNLWFPILLHFSWNFFLGPVYGFEVSGLSTKTIINHNVTGNELITGGKFGFEGSIVLTIMLVMGSILIDRIYAKASKIQAVTK